MIKTQTLKPANSNFHQSFKLQLPDLPLFHQDDLAIVLLSSICISAARILQTNQVVVGYQLTPKHLLKYWHDIPRTPKQIIPLSIHIDSKMTIADFVKNTLIKLKPQHLKTHPLSHIELIECEEQLKNHGFDIEFFYHQGPINELTNIDSANTLRIEVAGVDPLHQDNDDLLDSNENQSQHQHEHQNDKEFAVVFNPEKYSSDDIATFYHLVRAIIQQLSVNNSHGQNGLRIEQLSTITQQQHQLVVDTFNQTHKALPAKLNIIDLFHQQVAKQPQKTAVVYQDKTLTFEQLSDKSGQLAVYLNQQVRGQTPAMDDYIGLFVEPSIELLVGAWGILQAGSAYLPLSPEYPNERLSYMLSHSRCKTILVPEALKLRLQQLIPQSKVGQIAIVTFEQVKACNRQLVEPLRSDENLAYVIYTSGSTGKPKGVMIEHHSIANQMQWLKDEFAIGSQSVVLQKTPMSFDAAQWEILAPCIGATVVMNEPGNYKDPQKLAATIAQHQVTILQGVPTLLQALLDVEQFKHCDSLQQIFSGGEALSKHLALEIFEQLPQCQLINLYGPTECTINSSSFIVDKNTVETGPDTICIGKPIDNLQYYILDHYQMPVDVGQTGHLYVSGAGLARGYLHREDLTQERFVNAHFAVQTRGQNLDKSHRLYKTGDLACWNDDGTVQYIGRSDNQVKLRGYRVELDEIKSAIETHDWVNMAAVFVNKNPHTGYQNLFAMIELNPRAAALMDQGNHDAHHMSKQSRSQVKMQLTNKGCRQAHQLAHKATFALPGIDASPQMRETVFARKSYRFYQGGNVSRADIMQLLGSKPHYDAYQPLSALSFQQFGQLLRYFGQHISTQRLLPKYGYASPGALYATQMYLDIRGMGHLQAGYYYYHPVTHQLVLIKAHSQQGDESEQQHKRFDIHFIGKHSAIEPIYKNNILEVLEMEVGHMVGYFEHILPQFGLNIQAAEFNCAVKDLLEVEQQDYYLGCFSIVCGNPYCMDDDVDVYVQAHANKVADLNAGTYRYHNGQLTRLSDEVIKQKHVIAINQAVYQRSSFGISVVSNAKQDWLGYIHLGRKLQSLQMNDVNIGLMSSGYSSKSGNNLPSAKRLNTLLDKPLGPSYFFIGGRISDEQKASEGMDEDVVHMKGPTEMIQDDLANLLPSYMLPNKIEVIDKMPLTVNGKIDFKALAERDLYLTPQEHIEPSNDTERVLLKVWQKALKQELISTQADFFALGGNSLIAVNLINQINANLNCQLPLQILFQSPTIERLAKHIDASHVGSNNQKTDVEQEVNSPISRLIPLRPSGDKAPIYCWPGLGGYCMNLRLLAEKQNTERPFYGVQAYGINPLETPYATIKEMAAKDIEMIKQHQPTGPYTLWGYSFGARIAFEAAYQLQQAGDEVENLYLIAPGSPLIREKGLKDQHEQQVASFDNANFLTILYSVFMGNIDDKQVDDCLSKVNNRADFVDYICQVNNQLETDLVNRIIDIVAQTFEFKYTFSELEQRKQKAPIKIIKAAGDDYSFIEGSDSFYVSEPEIKQLQACHYSMLKPAGIDQLLAVL